MAMQFASDQISFHPTRHAIVLLVTSAWLALDTLSLAQPPGWQPLTVSEGVEISFVVHRYGDGRNAGVVIKLSNRNSVEASYRFRAVFKSENREWISDTVEGKLQPLEMKTGELSGLWWIPFKDGAPVTEVGLKGLRIDLTTQRAARNRPDTTS
ncbi:MAG: hypothetical protein WBW88_15495 [Rhodothermales bacterium]